MSFLFTRRTMSEVQFLFNSNGSVYFTSTADRMKTDVIYVRLRIPTSGIPLKIYEFHKTTFLTNREKVNMVFEAIVSEPPTDFKTNVVFAHKVD